MACTPVDVVRRTRRATFAARRDRSRWRNPTNRLPTTHRSGFERLSGCACQSRLSGDSRYSQLRGRSVSRRRIGGSGRAAVMCRSPATPPLQPAQPDPRKLVGELWPLHSTGASSRSSGEMVQQGSPPLLNKVFREFASGCVRMSSYCTRTRIDGTTWGERAARSFASG